MKSKLLKFSAVVAILFVLGGALLAWNINPILEKLRPQIIATITDSLGQKVTIGKISAKLFPSVAIQIDDVSLSESPDDASVETLLLDTSIFSLLKGEVEVSKLKIVGARINVNRKADGSMQIGTLNLGANDSATEAPEQSSTQTEPTTNETAPDSTETVETDASSSISFALQNADIKDVSFTWTDESVSPAAVVSITDFSAEVRGLSAGSKGTVKILASVLGEAEENLSLDGSVELGASLSAIPQVDLEFAIQNIDLAKVSALLTAYGAQPKELSIGDQLSYRMGIKIDSNGITVSPSLDATNAMIAFGEVFKKAGNTPLTVNIKAQPSLLGAVQASKVDLEIGGIKVQAPFSFNAKDGVAATLSSSQFPLAALGDFLPSVSDFALGGDLGFNLKILAPLPEEKSADKLPTLDGTVDLKSISARVPAVEGAKGITLSDMNGSLLFKDNSMTLKPLTFAVADQTLRGGVLVKNLNKPTISVAIAADSISLGPILSSLRTAADSPSPLEQSTLSGLKLAATYSLDTGKGSIKLNLGQSSLAGAPLKSLAVAGKAQMGPDNMPQSLSVKDAKIEAFGGLIAADFDLSGGDPFKGKLTLSSLQLTELSKVALGPESRISLTGLLDTLGASYTGSSKNPLPSLRASTSAKLSKGSISGFNILGQTLGKIDKIPGISGALAGFIPEKHRPLIEANSTAFDAITFKGNLAKEHLSIAAFELRHPLYLLTGSGGIGLNGVVKLNAQMRLTPLLAKEMILKEPKLQLLADKSGNIVFPVLIRKSPDGLPVVLPDISGLLQRAAKNTAKEAGKKALDKIAPGLGGALDSLF